jgi:hypothetical protein
MRLRAITLEMLELSLYNLDYLGEHLAAARLSSVLDAFPLYSDKSADPSSSTFSG